MTHRTPDIKLVPFPEIDAERVSIVLWNLARNDTHAGQYVSLLKPYSERRHMAHKEVVRLQEQHEAGNMYSFAVVDNDKSIGVATILPTAIAQERPLPIAHAVTERLAALGIVWRSLMGDERIAKGLRLEAWVGQTAVHADESLADTYRLLVSEANTLHGEDTEHRVWTLLPAATHPLDARRRALDAAGMQAVATGLFVDNQSRDLIPVIHDLYVTDPQTFGQLARAAIQPDPLFGPEIVGQLEI